MYRKVLSFLSKLGFPLCTWCGNPTWGSAMHQVCSDKMDQAWEEEDARRYAEIAAEIDAYDAAERRAFGLEDFKTLMETFCTHPTCYEAGTGVMDQCPEHDTFCQFCYEIECVCPNPQDDYPEDYDPEDDLCPGICNQPASSCSCAETKAWKEFQANPDTNGSWFVA